MPNIVRATGNIGARIDIAVRRGIDMTPYDIVLWEDDQGTVPFDLTSYVHKAAVRTRPPVLPPPLDGSVPPPDPMRPDPPIVAVMTATVQPIVANPIEPPPSSQVPNHVVLTMASEEIDKLPGPDSTMDPPVVCDWGYYLVGSDGAEIPLFYGEFEVNGPLPTPPAAP